MIKDLENENTALYHFLLAASLGHEGAKEILKSALVGETVEEKVQEVATFIDAIFPAKKQLRQKAAQRRVDFEALWLGLIV